MMDHEERAREIVLDGYCGTCARWTTADREEGWICGECGFRFEIGLRHTYGERGVEIVQHTLAAALRSAEESAARRCAEIVCVYCEMANEGAMGWLEARVNGGAMHRNMKTGRYARCRGHAIRSEFGLGEEGDRG